MYGISVTGGSESNDVGYALWNRLSLSFGYLTQAGYTLSTCTSGCTAKRFPIAIGAPRIWSFLIPEGFRVSGTCRVQV